MKEIIVEGEMIDDGELILKQPTPEEIEKLSDGQEVLIKTRVSEKTREGSGYTYYTFGDIVYTFSKEEKKVEELEYLKLGYSEDFYQKENDDKFELIIERLDKLIDYIKKKEQEK